TAVVRRPIVPLQEVRGDDRSFVSRDRREGQLAEKGYRVTRRVDERIRDALEELVHPHASVGLCYDIRDVEFKALQVRAPSRTVDDQVGFESLCPPLGGQQAV